MSPMFFLIQEKKTPARRGHSRAKDLCQAAVVEKGRRSSNGSLNRRRSGRITMPETEAGWLGFSSWHRISFAASSLKLQAGSRYFIQRRAGRSLELKGV